MLKETNLYNGLYQVISNKTVRQNEKFYRRYKKVNKNTPGMLVKTNRGWFIDGYQVDQKSVSTWFAINKKTEE